MFSVQDSTQHGCFKTSGNHFSWRNYKLAAPGSGQAHGRLVLFMSPGRHKETLGSQRLSPLNQTAELVMERFIQFNFLSALFIQKEMTWNSPRILKSKREEIWVWKNQTAWLLQTLGSKFDQLCDQETTQHCYNEFFGKAGYVLSFKDKTL